MKVFITAEELARIRHGARPPVVLDVRWTLAAPDGLPAFRASHIPGSIYVDLDRDLSGAVGDGTGRHPLPTIADLQRTVRSWGINEGDSVVVLDDADGVAAARAWWVLTWAGVPNVRILDGGFPVWAGHGATEIGVVLSPSKRPKRQKRGNITLSEGNLPTITADEAAGFAGVLLDARTPERFRGDTEPIDPRAGHIPGALNAPYADNLAGGTLRRPAELADMYAELGVDGSLPVGVYCGSGVSASLNVAALASIGIEAALYPGSWSQWSADPARPAETGAEVTAVAGVR